MLSEECAAELSIGEARLQQYADAVSDFWIAVQTWGAKHEQPEPPWVAAPDVVDTT